MDGQPSNDCGSTPENYLHMYGSPTNVVWNDIGEASTCSSFPVRAAVIEWSADCNNDGIVDYGQILAGELADANHNNIPDCCEQGAPCAPSAVQWRAADGGNGHWYIVHVIGTPTSWITARSLAKSVGGDLASLESSGEPDFILALTADPRGWASRVGPWLGGFQDPTAADFAEPAGGWRWVSGAPWNFTQWGSGEPNNSPGPENFLHLISNNCPGYPEGRFYNDVRGEFPDLGPCDRMPVACIIEWSADCNNDGIVDYGQILAGELADANHNNIPDCCEQGAPCGCPADIAHDGVVNGIDLAAVLNNWGTTGGAINADVNRDGIVNGSDLAIVLNSWGPCP